MIVLPRLAASSQARSDQARRDLRILALSVSLLLLGLLLLPQTEPLFAWLFAGPGSVADELFFWSVGTTAACGAYARRRWREQLAELERCEAAEAELQKSEEHFRALIDNAADPITILGADGGIRYESPAVLRMLGFRPDELVGASAFDFVHPHDLAVVGAAFAELLADPGGSLTLEFRFRCKDGRWIWLGIRGTNMLDHPTVAGILVGSRDVTARREAEAALRESEARLQRQNAALVRLTTAGAPAEPGLAAELRRLTETAAETLDVGRVGVWLFDAGRTSLRCTELFEREHGRHGAGERIEAAEFPAYFQLLEADRTVAADDALTHPATRGLAPGYLDRHGIGALLDAVVRVDGQPVGVVCHEQVGGPRRWTADELTFAGSIADLAASLLLADRTRKAEEENRHLAMIVENSDDAIVSKTLDGTVLTWNGGAERLYGFSAAEMVGGTMRPLFRGEDFGEEASILARVRRGERIDQVEARRLRRDGSGVVVSLSISPVRDAAGQIVGVSSIARDVTERVVAAEALRMSHERYRLVTRATSDAIYERDLSLGRIGWEEGAASILGYPAQLLGAQLSWWADRLHPDDRDRAVASLDAAVAGGAEVWADEYRFRRQDGSHAAILDRGFILRGARGEPLRMIGAMADISERKRIECDLRRAKDAAEGANRAKSDFLASMSHELRTPLNSVIGFAGVLRKNRGGRLAEQEILFLDRILANGTHLLGLINDVLDLSKIEAGKMLVERAPVDVGAVVRATLAELGGSVREGVELFATIDAPLAPIDGDAGKLRQIITNLVANALKFTEAGRVVVAVHADPATGRPLLVEVRDTGIGIAPDRLAAIFHAFEQEETGTARRFGGTGLGLSISSALARVMEMEIAVESRVGEGSTFRLHLARRSADAGPGGARTLPAAEPNPARDAA